MKEFRDKRIMITGAAGCLGRQLVQTFKNHGANIICIDRNEDKLTSLKKTYLSSDDICLCGNLLSDEFIKEIVGNYGNGVDIVVNNLGYG